uniref:Uncharacterized protein n=1 Tax=viral metagenome TaxID=1070528 RepID=A0A6M3KDK1_9ZZZZ
MAPELFQPDPSEIVNEFATVPPAADAGEEAQETTTEAPAGQPAAPAKEGARVPPPSGAAPQTITVPPGEEPPVQTEDTSPAAADADTGATAADKGTEALPFDVLIEAGKAGLSTEDVAALRTPDAIRAAIRIKGGGAPAATTTTAEPTAPSTASEPATLPELKPWELEVPKELEDPEMFDPKVSAYLKKLTEEVKTRDAIYRAHLGATGSRQTTPEVVDHSGEMMFDMTLNAALAKEQYAPYVEKLGVGWQFELSPEQYENRKELNSVAQGLLARQLSDGRRPKAEAVIMQAAGIVFPEIANKLGQKALLSKVAARPKVGRPGGGIADNRSPDQRALDILAEAKRAAGIG